MSATMVGRRQKLEKKLAKTPLSSPQNRNLDQNINDSKSHVWISFFENTIWGVQLFYIRPDVPTDIISFFLISDFLAGNLNANRNQRKRSLILQYSFAQKTLLILRTSTHLAMEIVCSRNTAKNLSNLKTSQPTCFCLVSGKTFALQYFLTPKNCIFEVL